MTTIICCKCGKEAQISQDKRLAVCMNIECGNWKKFAKIGSAFFHVNYMEVAG